MVAWILNMEKVAKFNTKLVTEEACLNVKWWNIHYEWISLIKNAMFMRIELFGALQWACSQDNCRWTYSMLLVIECR